MRPTLLPEWASSPTNITEPPSASKASGWGINEAPPSSYMNWLQSTTHDWLKYLSYEWLISDDFIRAFNGSPNHASGFVSTGFAPFWNAFGRDSSFSFYDVAGTSGHMNGAVYFDSGASQIAYICAPSQYPTSRKDYIFEAAFSSINRGNSGADVWIGMPFNVMSSSKGMSGGVFFSTTGTGQWCFQYGITAYAMGTVPTLNDASGFQKLTFEEYGSTATARISCPVSGESVVSFARTAAVFKANGSIMNSGIQINPYNAAYRCLFDYFRYGIRRT